MGRSWDIASIVFCMDLTLFSTFRHFSRISVTGNCLSVSVLSNISFQQGCWYLAEVLWTPCEQSARPSMPIRIPSQIAVDWKSVHFYPGNGRIYYDLGPNPVGKFNHDIQFKLCCVHVCVALSCHWESQIPIMNDHHEWLSDWLSVWPCGWQAEYCVCVCVCVRLRFTFWAQPIRGHTHIT